MLGAMAYITGQGYRPTCDEKGEVFNSYFSAVNVDDDGTLPDFPRRAKASINLDAVQFSTDKIHKAIKKWKPKFTSDAEGFPAYLVKQRITALPGPLSLLFNSFLSVGRIPSSWKKAIITPIYKKRPLTTVQCRSPLYLAK